MSKARTRNPARLPDDDWDESLDEGPSKSAVKREMTALQELGEALCELTPKQLARIPIVDEDLREAIDETHRIKSRSALKRHRQYIGKIMRRVDAEPLREALQALYEQREDDARDFHALEALRDRLIAEGDHALSDVLTQYPDADRQQLRQLVRTAQSEAKGGKAPAASRRLFRYLRDLQTDPQP
ncbi:MAG: ribosome biogenesis factor YjgA [Congregibacter sp.]